MAIMKSDGSWPSDALMVESWLDDHPEFTHDYFIRKASRQLVDDWLMAHAKIKNVGSQLDLQSFNSMSRPASQLSLNGLICASTRRTPGEITNTNNEQDQTNLELRGFGSCESSVSIPCRSTRSNSQSCSVALNTVINRSGAMTPVRKISANDFESRTGSGFLRPMLSTTPDGRLTFLVQPSSTNELDFCNDDKKTSQDHHRLNRSTSMLTGQTKDNSNPSTLLADQSSSASTGTSIVGYNEQHEYLRNSDVNFNQVQSNEQRSQYNTSNSSSTIANTIKDSFRNDLDDEYCETVNGEVKLIFELVKNICEDLGIRTLLHKILRNIAVLINADRSSLFLVCGNANDPKNRHLVSQLFNVDQDSAELNETSADDCIIIPWGTGIVGYVAESGESLNIADCYKDPRFTNAIDQRTGYVTKHMLCAPIFDKRGEIVGVAQVINKRDGNPFTKSDEIKFKRYLQFCGIGLRNAQSFEHCQLENKRNQVLLDLARMVFEEQSSIEEVVYRIMLHTQSLLDCERCQVLLIDNGNDDVDNLLRELPNCTNAFPSSRGAISSLASSARTKTPNWRPQCQSSNSSFIRRSVGEHHHDKPLTDLMNSDCDREKANIAAQTSYPIRRSSSGQQQQQRQQQQQWQPQQQHERASLSSKLFSLIFDLECDGANDPIVYCSKGNCNDHQWSKHCGRSRNFPINIGITGYVAMTGETLNIEDAHKHERFDPSVDDGSDFTHRSILCMPIRNGRRQIIGVSQLINKKNGRPFNKNDEDLFEAFSIFCGLGIHNTLMYERVLKIMAKQRVTFEVLSYHATAPLEEAKKLNQEQIPSCFALNLNSLKFNDFSLDDQYMLKSCLRFFIDLDLMRRFQIDQLVFCNWILSVQKNYRKVTYHPIVGGNGLTASPIRYHNWRHAFNVCQMMFAILVNTQICHALGELETLALLIACLCHDLDHRGTNNSFQIKSASPLAELYSTSTMEHHHFDQCIMILNSQGNQILANLTPEEYSRVVLLLEEAIIATDLANYFQKRDLFFKLVNSNNLDWHTDPEHRSLLRCMLMTACDVSAITKPWPVQKVVADLVMSEFYQQGDIERNELNLEPIDLMNREKVNELPRMQISFIDNICAPIYTAFAKLFPRELSTLLDGCLTNRELWRNMANNNTSPIIPKLDYIVDGIHSVHEQESNLQQLNNFSKSEANLNHDNNEEKTNIKCRASTTPLVNKLCPFRKSDIVDLTFKEDNGTKRHLNHRKRCINFKYKVQRKSV